MAFRWSVIGLGSEFAPGMEAKLNDEQYKNLIDWHRNTQKAIGRLEVLVGLIVFATVVAPIMKHYGWWNLAGW